MTQTMTEETPRRVTKPLKRGKYLKCILSTRVTFDEAMYLDGLVKATGGDKAMTILRAAALYALHVGYAGGLPPGIVAEDLHVSPPPAEPEP